VQAAGARMIQDLSPRLRLWSGSPSDVMTKLKEMGS